MIRFVLIGDGSSDKALEWPLRWSIQQWLEEPFDIVFADLRGTRLPRPDLAGRLRAAWDLYGTGRTVLLVHRDAEREPSDQRIAEIEEAAQVAGIENWVPVVPVRMTEAWLLIDEAAIRAAAGNPNGRTDLAMPALSAVERIPDPKQTLFDALCAASGLSGRKLQRFKSRRLRSAVHRVGALTADFTPLLDVSAFRQAHNAIQSSVMGPEEA